jgi:hypothetical protein
VPHPDLSGADPLGATIKQNHREGNKMKNNQFNSSIFFYVILVASLSLFLPSMQAQQSKTFASKGAIEIGGNISYQYTSSINAGTESFTYNFFSVNPYAGYFIADNIELGVNPIGIQTSWNSQTSSTVYRIIVAPAYNFKVEENVYPFVELQLGYMAETISDNFSSPTLSGFCWEGRSGVKLQIIGQGLINLGLQYQEITLNPSGATSRNGTNLLSFSAGFTFWF